MSSQKYQRLPSSSSIRLLRIAPGWPGDPLRVELTVIPDRNTAPPYDALSNVWGRKMSSDLILCNGVRISVTENLASALHMPRPLPVVGDPARNGVKVLDTARHEVHSNNGQWKGFAISRNETEFIEARRAGTTSPDGVDFIWIDALCFNQADLAECAEQVRGMRGIDTAARLVRIWLGKSFVNPDGSPFVLPGIKTSKLDDALNLMHVAELGQMPFVLAFIGGIHRNEELYDKSTTAHPIVRTLPHQDAIEWTFLRAFLAQPWFHCVWIVQEIVMARQAKVPMAGDWEFGRDSFAKVMNILDVSLLSHSQARGRAEDIWQGLNLAPIRYLCYNHSRPSHTNQLLSLLSYGRESKATKDVDHVFAGFGMATEVAKPDKTARNIS
ncbi:hypothetical protein B0T10DRAFT_556373 [Thelonectria olida]|uniref:Heterokaryon incompatibility domain-containing protein n=1 Tax=Thelonectria olida TaxID=1576542 RepID=A0A9P8WCL2_9HYPO|nr:hypothetical protein B0T10DRAFT_556373 [Thelonectria olida]